ncbi:hypothetical protein RFI_40273 [Reticulomyxa filosa]|uniref:Uncharacterized protein n=1 Tax=Reticulomyxa filosa TaxID=46433 RepID=X6L7G8_RETFI|nr:hypothetical protein RFI_40273 [Reticulomyxa filosa]|eukprot:ETN97258.1 hypothetical protein RFI_40273 [Reticulomyxa filosa]
MCLKNFDNTWQITSGLFANWKSRYLGHESHIPRSVDVNISACIIDKVAHHQITIIQRSNSKSADNTMHMEDDDEKMDDIYDDDHNQDKTEIAGFDSSPFRKDCVSFGCRWGDTFSNSVLASWQSQIVFSRLQKSMFTSADRFYGYTAYE